MAVTLEPPPREQEYEPELPSAVLPPPEVRDLPEPPRQMWRLIGPGVVGAGVGLASGEFILWPYITSQVGLIFLWGALLGVVVQWFLNMEIERYTLATGETALTGFNRYWKYWGLVFAVMVYLQNLWPGWATSSATMLTYLFGGSPTVIAIGLLVVIGAALTLAPVIYIALERLIFVKVAVIGLFVIVAAFTVINGSAWESLPDAVTSFGHVPTELGLALVMGAIAFAGAGGGQNLAQSNWIRDKGFGMGRYHPRLVSPVTGHEEAGSQTAGYVFEPTEENLARWRRWWRFANIEQASSFVLVTILTITFTSLIAFSSVFGVPGLENSIDFLEAEGNQLNSIVGGWFGTLFWAVGAFSLFAAAAGIVDYASRLTADILKTTYLRRSRLSEPALLRARLEPGRRRHPRPAGWDRPAARAPGHLGLRRRDDDVHVLATAADHEPAVATRADQDPRPARRRARLLVRVLRRAVRADHPRAGREALLMTATQLAPLPRLRVEPDALRRIRAAHATTGRRIVVLDDDPTGSQTVHGIQVVTSTDGEGIDAALAAPGSTCFVLTNTRSLPEAEAIEANAALGRTVLELGRRLGAPVDIISRSDSTLRGHVIAEVRALDAARRDVTGASYDGVLLVPSYFEAGRFTAGDIHYARVGDHDVPVGETEFARDATFGYSASDLREFVAEKSGGAISAGDVVSLGLEDIRLGGPERVAEVLRGISDGAFVVVNAMDYADLEVVALGLLAVEAEGRAFLHRSGPSFVRALAGLDAQRPLSRAEIWPHGHPGGHGLVVVGSHVCLSSSQVAVARSRGGLEEVELDVASVADPARREDHVAEVAGRVVSALAGADVLLFTSRTLARADDPEASLAVARAVSAAVVDVVRAARAARPAWVVAKGGITSHDVAVRALGIRRAEVLGQLLPGMVSVFRPIEAPDEVVGVPYVVFAGNVGDETTLAYVAGLFREDG